MIPAPPLTESEVEAYQRTVVPRYFSFYGALMVHMMLPFSPMSVVNIGCRWGFPDQDIGDRFGQGSLVGIDPSEHAIRVASSREAHPATFHHSYQVDGVPSSLAGDAFTHAISLHPICNAAERLQLLLEMRRLVAPGGQAVLALPLRGSFPEISDMVREYALRTDLPELGEAVDIAVANRPTIETIHEEFEKAGLEEVDVDVQLLAIGFASGKDFLTDPIADLVLEHETKAILSVDEPVLSGAIEYVRDAISKYWSEGVFELTVNAGCASGRKPGP